jgi:CDP-diacylglycerol--glycerol-3-phosphate 3-phosphatidyltransferase
MLNVLARARISVVLDPVGRALAKAGVSPDAVTVLGTVGVLVGAFGFVAFWLATTGHHASAAAALLCLVGAFTVSYVKARAEGLGYRCDVGIAERTERLLVAGAGAVLSVFGVPYAFDVSLWVLVGLCIVTIGQRLYAVRRQVAG